MRQLHRRRLIFSSSGNVIGSTLDRTSAVQAASNECVSVNDQRKDSCDKSRTKLLASLGFSKNASGSGSGPNSPRNFRIHSNELQNLFEQNEHVTKE